MKTNFKKKYLLGYINNESIYLSPPSWDCNWYWGFGYLGKKVKLVSNWEYIKEKVMEKALRAKWSLPVWKKLLLNTGDTEIVEWNNWNDKYWGATIKDGKGHNKLGLLLMKIRKDLRNG